MLNIVFWTNCQGGSIIYALNKYYSNLFMINSFLNYDYIKNKLPLPQMFKEADIFIYQNYADKPDTIYDLQYIFNELKLDCKKICIPFLQFDAIFCYDNTSPHNYKTISTNFPHGKFFYGIDLIDKQMQNINYSNLSQNDTNELINNIYNNLISDNIISEETIIYYYNRSFDYLKNKILSSDIPELYNYIKDNFTKIRLFHNRNHPTGILLNELIKYVFKILNLEYFDSINELDKSLNDWVMPILPCVKKYYNIDFDDKCSSWYNNNIIDTKTFIKYYIEDLYFN